MKKILILLVCSVLLFSSCGTYTGSGAYVGGTFGSVLGSAIGGLAGGPRGSDLGTIVGMAGGAAVGAAIGSQADMQRERDMQQYKRDKAQRRHRSQNTQRSDSYSNGCEDNYDSGFDATNSGDDRLYDFGSSDYTGNYSAQQSTSVMPGHSSMEDLGYSYSPVLEIRNARFVDANQDNKLNRNETCKVIFEIVNNGNSPLYDVVPTVVETTGNRHIFISPSIHVEQLNPGRAIRYTAMVKSDGRLKAGTACFCVSVVQGSKAISKVNEFNIPTTNR